MPKSQQLFYELAGKNLRNPDGIIKQDFAPQ